MTLLVPFARCTALVIMYLSPHPWVQASDWIQNEVPLGSVIAIEAWDHPLPIYGSENYRLVEIPIFDNESPSLRLALQDTIDQADYLIIASRRGYAALSRVSARYPTAIEHYSRLFNGELGFHPVRCFGRYPVIGPFALADQPLHSYGLNWHTICNDLSIPTIFNLGQLDESFVVYDHPTTIVFKRVSEASQPE